MFRKSYFYLFLATAILGSAQMTAYSQVGTVSGMVVLEKDGKTEPIAGAVIEPYRVDIKGGISASKTDKKGQFHIAGFMLGGNYVLSVSAPNCAPVLFPVRADEERLVIKMYPGDGHKFTEAEARKGASEGSKPGATDPGMSDEEKKEQAELEKKNAEIMAKNEKLKNADAIAARSNTEGAAALKAGNFDLALTKFNEGIAAVPDFVGSTPILINGKMVALKNKGIAVYREGAALSDATAKKVKFDEANKCMDDALAAFQDGVAIIKKAATDPTVPPDPKTKEVLKALYSEATEIHRLKAISGVDLTKGPDANAVINEYLAIETDPEKKLKAQMVLGDVMRKTGDLEKAAAAYRQVLALQPDNADATGSLGLTLFGMGASMTPEDKAMEQEGLNYMQKYVEISPISPTDPPAVAELKRDIKTSVDYLKSEKKLTPQKVTGAPKKK